MVITSFQIQLDNAKNKYLPGQNVTGNVVLKKSGNEKSAAIIVRMFGMAETNWITLSTRTHKSTFRKNEDGSRKNSFHTVRNPHHGQEMVLENTQFIFSDGKTELPLPSDEMKLPFSFPIPNRPLPITCNVKNEGIVTYGVEAILNNAPNPQQKCFIPISMLATPLDLNTIPGSDLPLDVTAQDRFASGCCCSSGELVDVVVRILRRGICVGETIPVETRVVNRSDKIIADVTAELAQVWTLLGQNMRNPIDFGRIVPAIHVVPLAMVNRGQPIPAKSQEVVCPFQLKVPENIPPTIPEEASAIIKMRYAINVRAVVENGGCCGMPASVQASLPVVVGNTPAEPRTNLSANVPANNGAGGAF